MAQIKWVFSLVLRFLSASVYLPYRTRFSCGTAGIWIFYCFMHWYTYICLLHMLAINMNCIVLMRRVWWMLYAYDPFQLLTHCLHSIPAHIFYIDIFYVVQELMRSLVDIQWGCPLQIAICIELIMLTVWNHYILKQRPLSHSVVKGIVDF